MTATRASVSALSCGKSCVSAKCSSSLIALSCSGRDSRTMRTGPSASTRMTSGRSYFIASPLAVRSVGQAEDAGRDDVLLDLRRAAHDALGPAVEVRLQRHVVGGRARRAIPTRRARRRRRSARPRSSAACRSSRRDRARRRRAARTAGGTRAGAASPLARAPTRPPRAGRCGTPAGSARTACSSSLTVFA